MEVVFTPNDVGKRVYHPVYGEGFIKECSDIMQPPERFTLGCTFHNVPHLEFVMNGYGQEGLTSGQAVFKGPVRLEVEEEYDDWKTPPVDLKVDDPVVIRNCLGDWVNRHFKEWRYLDGQWFMVVFPDGRTSYSDGTSADRNGFQCDEWKIPKKS